MNKGEKENRISKEITPYAAVLSVICVTATVLTALLLFFSNVRIPFMMDDLWYATDLRDGSTLDGIGDVVGSQVWHYMNWGGRSFTHAFLQFSLMSGERAADVINTVLTLVLAFLMCVLSGISAEKKSVSGSVMRYISEFALALGILITCCPNFRMSMLWQAGCANYVYSSVWIVLFYIVYLRTLDPNKKDIPLVFVFMPFLGLITGWSTENMGPSSCIAAALVTFICIRRGGVTRNRKIWMIEGVIASFIGSCFCILAPGNFVRKTDSTDDLALTLPDRLLQMLRGAGDYLFLSLVLLAGALIAHRIAVNEKLSAENAVLLVATLLSYGAMIASPHYPDRAAFGTCVLIEVVSLSLMRDVFRKENSPARFVLPIMLLVSSAAVMYFILV
ncbi:MAG: hypothetical protein J5570_05765 [Lachnospiraceae bacterium]|nr:hypothetical protein [Lachnospiraceae bacterium]